MKILQLQRQFDYYLDQIEQWFAAEKSDQIMLVFCLLRLLETKGRLERLGERINELAFQRCLAGLEKHRAMILTSYCDSFTFDVAEQITDCARRIEQNLELFVQDESRSEAEQDLLDELEQHCFDLLRQRETSELIYLQMQNIFTQAELREAELGLRRLDRAIADLYLPEKTAARVEEYLATNSIDRRDMPWFDRPGIEHFPVVPSWKVDEWEAEVLAERKPVSVPEIVYYQEALRADSNDCESDYRKLMQFLSPLWEWSDERLTVKILQKKKSFLGKLTLAGSGRVSVYLNEQPLELTKNKFTLGAIDEFAKPFALEIFIDDKLHLRRRLYLQPNKL